MNKKKVLVVSGTAAVFLIMAVPVFADTATPTPAGQTLAHQFRKGSHKNIAGQHGMHQKLANATFGTISNINGSVITLTRNVREASSTVTVTTTDTTTYKKNGQPDVASDLAIGQRIVAMGTKDSSGNISNATSVNIFIRPTHNATTSPQ